MPHTVPNRPMYGLVEPTVARKLRWCLQAVCFAGQRNPHGAFRTFDNPVRRNATLGLHAVKFAEPGFEQLFQAVAILIPVLDFLA